MPTSPFSFTVGGFKCFAIRDGGHMGSADFLFVNAPQDELKDALQSHNLVPDQLQSTWTCLLVDTGDKSLLIDTGIGSGVPAGGDLLGQLEEIGYPADGIDIVFLTHGHPDHIGGCTDEDGIPVFPQAQYMMGVQEYKYWMNEDNWAGLGDSMVRFVRKNLPGIQGQLDLVEAGAEILPGIQVIEAFGHTPGHLGLEISSGKDKLLHLADSALHPLHLEHPDWYAQVDILPDQMIATRKRLLQRAVKEEVMVLLFHFDFPSMGFIVDAGNNWRWRSLVFHEGPIT